MTFICGYLCLLAIILSSLWISWILICGWFLDVLEFFFYLLDTSSLSDMCVMPIFSQSMACLLIS